MMEEQQAVSSVFFDGLESTHTSEPEYKFRNHVPQSKFLHASCVMKPSEPQSITHLIQDKLDLVQKGGNYRIDPKMLEPKKVDWDLKRRYEKRLKKLERDTSRSISEHIKRERKKT